jgi:hypothetical protein
MCLQMLARNIISKKIISNVNKSLEKQIKNFFLYFFLFTEQLRKTHIISSSLIETNKFQTNNLIINIKILNNYMLNIFVFYFSSFLMFLFWEIREK